MPSTKVKKSEIHQWEIYTAVPVTKSGTSSPKGDKGPYVVIFTLSNTQNVFTSDFHPATQDDGNSNIYLHEPGRTDENTPVKQKIESGSGIVYWQKSNDGMLNIIETEPFIADNFEKAISLAYNNISPYLSQLSYLTDTPLSVQKIDATALNSGSQRFIGLPNPPSVIYPYTTILSKLTERTAQLLAEYREAKNASTLPIYQLFCYFKIIDGYLSVKAERAKNGMKPITSSDEIKVGIYKGKKVGWLRDKLREEFRNEFAHFTYSGEKTKISPDNMDNIYQAFESLPSAHSAARQAIQNLIDADNS